MSVQTVLGKDFNMFKILNPNAYYSSTANISTTPPNLTTDTVTVFDRQSTKDGSPIVKTFNLAYDSITSATLKVQLFADDPLFKWYGWKLTKITVNDRVFFPSNIQESTNLIQDNNNISSYFKNTLNPSGTNTIAISFDAPLGSGVVFQSNQISAQLIINGQKNALGVLGINGTSSFSDIFSTIQTWFSNNLPLGIAILILITIIIVAIAYSLSRVPKLPSVPS